MEINSLRDLEPFFRHTLNYKKIIRELEEGFKRCTENEESIADFEKYLEGKKYYTKFIGISFMIIEGRRQPFYRALLGIFQAGLKGGAIQLGTYEIEYSLDGEFLDEFLVYP
jgi:hypothetical protein